ncbi:transporter substrate-binding domain-containing protein [Jannaschia sp. Os4]|uniref:ion channel n=1 Tax=Jannaschia sp. Os4 TaxID=2807617 RepID=UPI001939FCFB|nr:ion channel [Jannaschia sp. Os4]MBM2574814.1 transporter substrate-binding domain-containing protein [Jannaschia sp. Os4]
MLRSAARAAPLLLLLASVPAAAQDLRVAVIDAPPFAQTGPEGARTGIAVDLLRLALDDLGLSATFEDADGTAPAALADGADIVLPVSASPDLARTAALTVPIYTATLGAADAGGGRILAVLQGLASWTFLRIVLGVCALLLVVGAVVWLLERRRNDEMFHPDLKRGLGDGFWWAGVTLTTIGYGDKAPATTAGRAVAMLWMLTGLAVSASLTAAVVSMASGGQAALSLPGDLEGQRVVVAEGGAAEAYVRRVGLPYEAVPDLVAALAAVKAKDADVALGGAPALRAASDGDLRITETRLDPVLVTFALPKDSDLRQPLDVALLTLIASGTAQDVARRYLPDE